MIPQTIDALKTVLETCGVVGAGGGGFPSHLKIDPRTQTILVNGAECEPLLQVDQQLMEHYTREILEATHILANILNAQAVIALKDSYTNAITAFENIIEEYPPITLKRLRKTYPAGDEMVLIYEALGAVVPPGGLPMAVGCTVFNVETMYNMYYAFTENRPVTHKWVTIAGEVEKPVTALFPIGTTIAQAIQAAGKITTSHPIYINGGPMMGHTIDSTEKITKTTKAILVLPQDHLLAYKGRSFPGNSLNRVASACCQCRNCTDMCPRHLLGHPIEPHRIMRAMAARDATSTAYQGAMYCSMCGLCEMVACPQSLAPRTLIKAVKSAMQKEGLRPKPLEATTVVAERGGRLVSSHRLTTRLGLAKYDIPAPIQLKGNVPT